MLRLDYTVKLLAPVTFAEKSGDNVLYATKRYIPGSAIRGSLANLLINIKQLGSEAHLDEEFFDLFLSGKLKFLPCYFSVDGQQTIPVPASVFMHKNGKEFMDISFSNSRPPMFKKMSGFVALKRNNNSIQKLNPNVMIEFHMSRASEKERILGSSTEGAVFNYEYLESHQEFSGSVIAADENRKELEKIESLLKKTELHLGRSKKSQYGTAIMVKSVITKVEDEHVKAQGYLYAMTPYITKGNSSRLDVIAEEITEKINNAIGTKVVSAAANMFVNTEQIDGYVGAWNVKRERKTAVASGSMFEINIDQLNSDIVSKLTEVLHRGIGLRTEDGYGQFRIWQPMPEICLKKAEQKPVAPVAIPEIVKAKAKQILQERLLIEVCKKAEEKALGNKAASSAKNTFKRIELLMGSRLSKKDIEYAISDFKPAAKHNLEAIRIDGYNFWEILLHKNGAKYPYENMDWAKEGLELSKNQIDGMIKDLGDDALVINKDVLYKKYWLWFMRHSSKKIKLWEKLEKEQASIKENARVKGDI